MNSEKQEVTNLETMCEEKNTTQSKKDILLEKTGKALYQMREAYFRPKSFEKSGKIYRYLGTHIYKKFLPTGGNYIQKYTNLKLISGKKDLKKHDKFTRIAETAHTLGFILYVTITNNHFEDDKYILGGIGIAANLLINVYPVFTQRYNRSRIYKLLDKQEKREKRQKSLENKTSN